METTKTDLRAVRTDKAIRHAFEEMLVAGVRPIQVTALTKRAGINRKTFYLHYDTIDDLADTYIADVQADLYHRLSVYTAQEYLTHRGLLITVFSDFFLANKDFYTSILFQDEYWPRVRRLQEDITKELAGQFAAATGRSMDESTLIVTFSCSTMITMLRLRANGRIQLTPEEIRDKIVQLNIDGLRGAMGLEI